MVINFLFTLPRKEETRFHTKSVSEEGCRIDWLKCEEDCRIDLLTTKKLRSIVWTTFEMIMKYLKTTKK